LKDVLSPRPCDIKVVFAGTPHFADAALQALLKQGFNIVAVFTQPDRPSGRGLKLTPSPVKQTGLAHNIPVHQPRSLRLDGKHPEDAAAAQAVLNTLQADVMVVAAYGLILPQWTLDVFNAPKAGCVNIHASLLPRWRGAAPIQRAIAAGDTASGVCLMQMEIGLDTGAVYAQRSIAITPATTGGDLHDALAALGADMVCQLLPAIVAGHMPATAQSEVGVTYAHKLLREHGALNWNKTATELANQIRAFDPTPGCSFEHAGQVYKVWAAHALAHSTDELTNNIAAKLAGNEVGNIVAVTAQGVDIVCGKVAHSDATHSVLRITEIQKAGGKRLPVAACWQHLGIVPTTVTAEA
jgi:methionyl-tRNA formyltransferase